MNLNPVPSLPTEQSIIGIPGGGGGNINNYDLSYFARALHTIKRAQTHVKSTVKIKLSSSEINFIALLSISRYTYNNELIYFDNNFNKKNTFVNCILSVSLK